MKITYPDSMPMTLKITSGEHIYRLFFENGLRLGTFATVEAAIKDALLLPEGFQARYKCKEGKDKILSEKTFGHFLSTASAPKESAHKVLRLEVSTAKAQDPALHCTWQEDPRSLDELLAQFSDEDMKSNAEALTCARRPRKGRQKKKEGTRKSSRQAEASQLNDEHRAENAETPRPEGGKENDKSWQEGFENVGNDAGPEERKQYQSEEQATAEEVYVREGKHPEQEELRHYKNQGQKREDEAWQKMERHKKAGVDENGDDDDSKQYTGSNLESEDGLTRSKSCPCLLTHTMGEETPKTDTYAAEQSPENGGCLWPATPDCTPLSSPRQGCGQHHMAWVPMPVWLMPMMSVTAY